MTTRLNALFACILFLAAGAVNAAAAELAAGPGLVGHYYGNQSFLIYGGKTAVPSLNFSLDLKFVPWPPRVWDDDKKNFQFKRDDGWSMAVYGSLRIDKAGAYLFTNEGSPAQLWVDGCLVRLDGKKPVSLKAGSLPVRLLLKSEYPLKDWKMSVHLKWRTPGAGEDVEIPAELFSRSDADLARVKAVTFDIPMVNPTMPYIGMRDYPFEVPKDGFYELSMHYRTPPYVTGYCDAFLDGKFLYHYNSGAYKWGFMATRGTVKYLLKGSHTLRISSQTAHVEHSDLTGFIEDTVFGWNRLGPGAAELSLSVTEQDREDMVFKKGEALVLRLERMTTETVEYTVTVRRQRGDGATLWSAKAALPANLEHAAAELRYPCPAEGAFEYSVLDGEGQVVEGPWAFVVVDPTPLPNPKADAKAPEARELLVDQVDCAQPEDAAHKFRDNGTSTVVDGPHGKYRVTGRSHFGPRGYVHADGYKAGLPNGVSGPWRVAKEGEKPLLTYRNVQDWFAYSMKVKNPGRPHKVTAWVPTDVQRQVAVRGLDPVTGFGNGAEVLAGDAPRSEPFVPLSFLVYPNTDYLDIIAVCTDHDRHKNNRQAAVARIELRELPDGLPPLPEAAGGWAEGKEFAWGGEQIDLGMEQRMMPKFWDDSDWRPASLTSIAFSGGYYDWKALLTVWERVGEYCRYQGRNLLVWPVYDYGFDMLRADRLPKRREAYSRGWKYRLADRMRRDQLKLILLLCEKYHVRFVADFFIQQIRAETVLATDTGRQWSEDGLFLTGPDGKVVTYPARVLNPAHPLSRQYLVEMFAEIGAKYGFSPAFAGINIRQSGWHSANSGWFYDNRYGYDDFTVGVFEKETGVSVPVEKDAPDRFQKRRDYLLAKEREKWFRWRSDKVFSLREELLAALRAHAPNARLYGGAKPNFDEGRGLDDKQLAGRRDLGYGKVNSFGSPGSEFNVGDPVEYRNFDLREPASLRLDPEMFSGREIGYPMEFNTGGGTIRCHPYQLEEPSKSLADGPLETVVYSPEWAPPAMDEGIRRWAQAWRAIPDLKFERLGGEDAKVEPVQCWFAKDAGSLVFYVVNGSAIRRELKIGLDKRPSSIRDLVSGRELETREASCNLVLDPFMLAVVRADGCGAVRCVEMLNREIPIAAGELKTPAGAVKVGALTMDKFEVSNAFYERFEPARRGRRSAAAPGDNSPVVEVSWLDAVRFCNWRSRQAGLEPCYDEVSGACDFSRNGYRLPTEAEWELAAAGAEARIYPWGSAPPAEGLTYRCKYGNYDVPQRAVPEANPLARTLDGFKCAAPVGSFENFATPAGVCDLAGNVWEWCQDAFAPDANAGWRSLRGGSWRSDAEGVRCQSRTGAPTTATDNHIGFRCVRGANPLAPPAAKGKTVATTPWLDQAREWRVAMVVSEPGGAARANELVVLTGRELLDRAPGAKVKVSSLQIRNGATIIPCQVDEKDGTGDYVEKPNGVLDLDDEICFQVSLPARGALALEAYFSAEEKTPATPGTDLASSVPAQRSRQEPYNLLLRNGKLEVGINGPAEDKKDGDAWQAWSPGVIRHLRSGGMDLVRFDMPAGAVPASTWPATPGMPKVVAAGPVRLVAKVAHAKTNLERYLNANPSSDGNLKGAVRTYYYQLAANSPVIEFTDDLRYDRDDAGVYKEWWQYMHLFPGGKGCHAEQVVCYSQDGQPKSEKLAEMAARHFVDGKLSRHFGYASPDGWVAVLDLPSKSGVAFFGAPGINKMTVLYHKDLAFGGNLQGSIFQNLFINENLTNQDNRQLRRYWLVILGDENLEGVVNWRDAFLNPARVIVTSCEMRR